MIPSNRHPHRPISPVMSISRPRWNCVRPLDRSPRWPWRRCLILPVLAMAVMTSATWAEDPPIDRDDVLDWIDDLDASSLARRKAAEAALIQAGAGVLEMLPESDEGISLEAAGRLRRVRKALRELAAKAESRTEAVEVRLDDVSTLGEALEAISRDSGVEFEFQGNAGTPIEPIPIALSFWHAVDYVLDQAKLDINFYGGDRETLQLIPRDAKRPSRVDSAAYAGVYRIEPTSVTARRSLVSPDLSGLNVSLEISWQPGMTPIGLTIPIRQLVGRLDEGSLLRPQASGEQIDVAATADLATSEFFVPLQLPAGRPDKISSMTGIIHALLPGPTKLFEIETDSADRRVSQGAMTVSIEDVRPNGPLHEFRVGVELADAGRALESHRQWIYENEAYVEMPDGSRADHLGYEVYRSSKNGIGIGYLFDIGDSAEGTKLKYRSPTSVVPNEVAFVIQDIALP